MSRRCIGRAALTLGILVMGCGVPIEEQATSVAIDQVPEGLRPTDTTTPEEPVASELVDIWLVRDDELVTTRHLIEAPATAQAALTELLAGPTSAEQERSLRSAIPDASVVIDVELLRGVATVDLSPSFSDIPAQDQVFAVGQIVLTMTDLRGVGRVRFVVDDAQIAVPLPSGDTSEDTVSREDYLAMADNSA